MTDQPGERSCDGGQQIKGRKRHLWVNTLGMLLLVVTTANVRDEAGAKQVMVAAKPQFPRLKHLWADTGYNGADFSTWVGAHCRWTLEIVQHLAPKHIFEVQRRR